MYGKPLKKNGVEYMDVEKITLTFTTTRMRLDLSNLFNGDKALGKSIILVQIRFLANITSIHFLFLFLSLEN